MAGTHGAGISETNGFLLRRGEGGYRGREQQGVSLEPAAGTELMVQLSPEWGVHLGERAESWWPPLRITGMDGCWSHTHEWIREFPR